MRIVKPYADHTPAIGVPQEVALAGFEVHGANGEAGPLDHRLVAARAEGRLRVLQLADVADVDVVQPAAGRSRGPAARMSTGVGGRCVSLCSGWKREKCSG